MSPQNKIDRAGWFEGSGADCTPDAGSAGRSWRLVLLGAPGVGKGTQAECLNKRLGACHLSTGDLFRDAEHRDAGHQSPAMAQAMESMHHGALVSDTTVWELVRERGDCLRCSAGFLLDGFPRTLAQAEQLKAYLEGEKVPLTAVLDYEMPVDEIVKRLSGRRICEKCHSVFHVTWRPPKVAGVCDVCGGRLQQREDDQPSSISIRLEAYRHSTAPLIQYYKDLNLLVSIDANGPPEDVCARTLAALESRVK